MSNETFSFYYDPTRQGYDANTWSTISGAPIVVANHLSLGNSEIIHFADLLRGDLSMSIGIDAPAAGDAKQFGFMAHNKDAHLTFKIADDVLTAESSDGVTVYSQAIDWNTDWSNVDTVFRIKWEPGIAFFYIDGQLKATFSDAYALGVPTIVIPGDTMSIYISNNANSALSLDYFEVLGIQSSNLEVL